MAKIPDVTVKVDASEEFMATIEETRKELLAAREALSEERIRAIVREELAAWEKRLVQARRFGLPANMEAK